MIELATDRLILRPHVVADFDDCAAMWGDPIVTRHITSGKPHSQSDTWARLLRYAGHWSLLGYGFWAIRDRATDRFLGEAGFMDFRREIDPPLVHPECGWVLAAAAHGKGYATEAVRAATAWADGRFARTTCIIDHENAASIQVAAKCGYRETGRAVLGDKTVLVFER